MEFNMSYIINNLVDIEDGPRKLPFGGIKVASPRTMFLSTLENDDGSERWQRKIEGGGSTTYEKIRSALRLQVGTAQGDRVLIRTFQDFIYQPGSSTRLDASGKLGPKVAGVEKRLGMYDDENGLYFKQNGNNFAVVIRRTLEENNTVEEVINQADFNLDKLDGTGPSGIVLDTGKPLIFHIDYVWHGIGPIRFGILLDADLLYFHQENNTNIRDELYMGKGTLPCSYEIINIDGSSEPAEMEQLSTSVKMDEGTILRGYSRAALTPASTTVSIPSGSDFYNVISIRIKSNCPRCSIGLFNASIANISNGFFQFAIIKNANGLGSFTWVDASDHTEQSITGGTVTGGVRIVGGVGERRSDANIDLNAIRDEIHSIFLDDNFESETFTLAARRLDGNADVAGSVNFIEFR
jgi:hypothetical protein